MSTHGIGNLYPHQCCEFRCQLRTYYQVYEQKAVCGNWVKNTHTWKRLALWIIHVFLSHLEATFLFTWHLINRSRAVCQSGESAALLFDDLPSNNACEEVHIKKSTLMINNKHIFVPFYSTCSPLDFFSSLCNLQLEPWALLLDTSPGHRRGWCIIHKSGQRLASFV